MSAIAQSSIRNRLLSALSADDFRLLSPYLQPVELIFKQIVIAPDEPIPHAYFVEKGMGSQIALFEGGGSMEVGMIGWEGMIGVPLVLGVDRIVQECLIQVPGSAWRVDASDLKEVLRQSQTLQTWLLRYTMAFLAQVSQTAACNGAHKIEERLARWLLMSHDRCDGDRVALTQEFLGVMLGVRRAGITVAAGVLQKAGMIAYASGDITILNRPALEVASCACYGIVKEQEDRILGSMTDDGSARDLGVRDRNDRAL